MKRIGIVGGISWTSTLDYYKLINEGVNAKLGGLNFAECVIYSLNFGDVQEKGWTHSYDLLFAACKKLEVAGADAIVLGANTAHLFADQLEAAIQLPIIHIVTETAKSIDKQGYKKAALIGTRFTMEMDFYKNKLEEHGIEVMIPAKQETRDYIQHTIKEELGRGIINAGTKANYISILEELLDNGAECIILGCTEIPLLIGENDFSKPVFNTTKIHSQAIVEYITT